MRERERVIPQYHSDNIFCITCYLRAVILSPLAAGSCRDEGCDVGWRRYGTMCYYIQQIRKGKYYYYSQRCNSELKLSASTVDIRTQGLQDFLQPYVMAA